MREPVTKAGRRATPLPFDPVGKTHYTADEIHALFEGASPPGDDNNRTVLAAHPDRPAFAYGPPPPGGFYAYRPIVVPSDLDALRGPLEGVVQIPAHIDVGWQPSVPICRRNEKQRAALLFVLLFAAVNGEQTTGRPTPVHSGRVLGQGAEAAPQPASRRAATVIGRR